MAINLKKTEAPKGKESAGYAFAFVCRSDELPEGEVRQLKARGKEIAVGRLAGGQLFAVGGRCPHMRARLGKGKLEGTLLECPWHGARFDATDGCLARWVQRPALLKLFYEAAVPDRLKRSVPAYEVKEENGDVMVAVD